MYFCSILTFVLFSATETPCPSKTRQWTWWCNPHKGIWWWVFSPVIRFVNSLFAHILSCFANVSGQTSWCMTQMLKTFLSYFLFHLIKRTKLFGFVFLSDHTSFSFFVVVVVLQKNHLLHIIQHIPSSFACEGCSQCWKGHQLNNCKS